MDEKKNSNIDDAQEIAKAIAAEFHKNDDIVDYIQPSSLELLKARYATADEDESIRGEGFDIAPKSGLLRKPRPESVYGYYFNPRRLSTKDEIKTEETTVSNSSFDVAQSEFDADSISFGDINLDEQSAQEEKRPEQSKPAGAASADDTFSLNADYNTNTRVVFSEDIDDGIRRNTDAEMEAVFSRQNTKKQKFLRRNKNGKQKRN